MGEKKGQTVKLIFDFPTQLSTEVFEFNQWLRVTANRFRSFNGQRRILKFDKENKPYYEEYKGPVYLYETNKVLKDNAKIGYVYPEDFNHEIILRPNETHYLDDPKVREQKYGTINSKTLRKNH
jgi:hypothetical protein